MEGSGVAFRTSFRIIFVYNLTCTINLSRLPLFFESFQPKSFVPYLFYNLHITQIPSPSLNTATPAPQIDSYQNPCATAIHFVASDMLQAVVIYFLSAIHKAVLCCLLVISK